MSLYNYTKNQSNYEDIEKHLLLCSKLFSPALDSYVNIPEYAKKIRDNAETNEAWINYELVGLVACYLNDNKKLCGYITNVSVILEHQGKGIAKRLIENTVNEAKKKGFITLNLEVEVENKHAIELYKKTGFVLNGRQKDKYLMISRLCEKRNITVSVCCVTYNHVKYIHDTIGGFLMQKTNFPIEILIHDDASTDGTAEILMEYGKKYPDIIKPIYQKKNQYSQGRTISATYQFPRAFGKYIAICEGDDYWIDPYKLQKQVDFLENNPDYGMIHTAFKWLYPDSNEKLSNQNVPTGDIYDDILVRSFIGTLTTLTRKCIIEQYLTDLGQYLNDWRMGDRPLWLYVASRTKISYLTDITSVYRQHKRSLTSFNSTREELEFFKESYRIRFFFIEKIGKPKPETTKRVYENYYRGLLEINSKNYDQQASHAAFRYLKDNQCIEIKDYLYLLRSGGPFFNSLSSVLAFLFFGKRTFLKKLVKHARIILI